MFFKHILKEKKWIKKIGIPLFWILIWQLVALAVSNAIILASPIEVLKFLVSHSTDREFLASVWNSLWHIVAGFLLAFICGVLVAVAAYVSEWMEELFYPLMTVIKATPVAAITVLLLLWCGSGYLSVIICFLIVFPNMYEQTLMGLKNVRKQLLEMAECYKLSLRKKIRYIYRTETAPYILGSMKVCIGLSFKSAVAAEIIATPVKTMGERLYFSKIHLDTPGLFGWTFVIILLSALTEKIFLKIFTHLFYGTAQEKFKKQKEESKSEIQEICLKNVSKNYDGQRVLEGINGRLKSGGCYEITAASGAGKTTLLRLLAGLEKPDEGEISFINTKEAIQNLKFGMVFQDEVLCEAYDVINNIEMVRKEPLNKEEMKDLLTLLPESCIHKKASQLSGGMKRRVQILRALFSDADVLLFDEPFRGLDEENREKSRELIQKYQKERILLITTHDKTQKIDIKYQKKC